MSSGPDANLHVLVMAAGASRRFGSPKQLLRVDGRPMLHRAVAAATEVAGHAVTVVLGANAAQLTALLKHTPGSVIINQNWEEGLASSLRFGIRSLPGACDGALIVLADQVSVTSHDLLRLASAWRRQTDWIIAASYAGLTGVPAVFPRWCFTAFSELRGDQGARAILTRAGERVLRIPMPNAAVDIDTPEDLLQIETDKPGKPSEPQQ